MSIIGVRIHSAALETVHRYTMSSSEVATPHSTIVELIDDSGLSGFGEACVATPQYQDAHNAGIQSALAELAPQLLGCDPVSVTKVHAVMDAHMDGARAAKAAVDIACWDLAGKLVNRPVYELLGGRLSDPVLTYHVIGIGDPAESATQAAALQDAGITKLQLKAGGRAIGEDIEAIHAVAGAVRPGTDLFVDTNRGWTTGEALLVSKACRDITMWMEQPVATEQQLRTIKPQLHHPLVVDESSTDIATVSRLVSDGIADGFGLKLTRLGGLTPTRTVRDLCAAAKIPISTDDAWGGDIIAAACAHLGATVSPQLHRGAWLSHPYHQRHYDEANGPRLDGGSITVPTGAGLGLVLDPSCFDRTILSVGQAT